MMTFQNKISGKAKKIIFSILILIVIFFAITFIFRQSMGDAARQQVQAISIGDVAKAYGMTSRAFQQQTGYDNFVRFVNEYPILKHTKELKFSQRKIDNGVGYLAGTLEADDGAKMTIEFQLVKENDEWKIQAIRLTPVGVLNNTSDNQAAPSAASGPLVLDSILVGDTADVDGYVQTENIHISRTAPKIFATVKISAPEKGAEISATLTHTRSGSKIGPILGIISRTGSIMKAFSFTRGEDLWPKGDYEIQVITSTGVSKIVRFEVK